MYTLLRKLSRNHLPVPEQQDQHQPIIELQHYNETLSIRNISYDELEAICVNWAKAEGWASLKHGINATYRIDPKGFYVLEQQQQKMASISVVSYPLIKLAYIGFFIVPKPLRARGYGALLFENVLQYSENSRGISSFGLNCVEAMVPMYQKWGFETKAMDEVWQLTLTEQNSQTSLIKNELLIENIDKHLFEKLVKYDSSVFGTHRSDYLYYYINKPNTYTLICSDEINKNILGYAVMGEREPAVAEAHASYRVGPLYAANPSIAATLLTRLIALSQVKPNESIYLETTGLNPESANLVQNLGFKKIASLPKLYKGSVPMPHDTSQMFCYSSIVTG